MTNHDHIRHLLLEAASSLRELSDRSARAQDRADFAKVCNASDDAREELDRINPDTLAEAYDVKALYDRTHLAVVSLRCLRVQLEECERHAEAALENLKRVTFALEESDSDDNL